MGAEGTTGGHPNRAARPLCSPAGEHQQHRPHTPAAWSCLGKLTCFNLHPECCSASAKNNCCSFVASEMSSCQQSCGPAAPCLREPAAQPQKSPCTWQSRQQRTIFGFCPTAGQTTGSGSASPLAFKCAAGGVSGSCTLNVRPQAWSKGSCCLNPSLGSGPRGERVTGHTSYKPGGSRNQGRGLLQGQRWLRQHQRSFPLLCGQPPIPQPSWDIHGPLQACW